MKTIYKNLILILMTITLIFSINGKALAEEKYVEVACGIIDKTVAIPEEDIRTMCEQVCKDTKIEPEILEALCYEESRFNPAVESKSKCIGLCQVSSVYYKERAEELEITDFYEPYSNLTLCVSILEDLIEKYDNYEIILMSYNLGEQKALKRYKESGVSEYAQNILNNAEKIKESKTDPEVHIYKGEIPYEIKKDINEEYIQYLLNLLPEILK